ncbi:MULTISPECIES: membrane protein insertion efficiency factor YidD [unclassified Luteococcus]|uniref:membrane protein insertion efficiency factor YidD n=1 Tax=unclassified Luteococcus TaxID=2639923 RepID=UPI00313DC261
MLIDSIALRLVEGYRASLSPRKGWRCASGVAGHGTCSTVIRDSLVAHGALRSVGPAARQFATCARSAAGLRGSNVRVEGVCCCGPIPIPFRF